MELTVLAASLNHRNPFGASGLARRLGDSAPNPGAAVFKLAAQKSLIEVQFEVSVPLFSQEKEQRALADLARQVS